MRLQDSRLHIDCPRTTQFTVCARSRTGAEAGAAPSALACRLIEPWLRWCRIRRIIDAPLQRWYALLMRPYSVKSLWLVCTVMLGLIGASATTLSQSHISLKKELVWSLPENEIASPQFSADGKFIVVVSRVHWPDGEEAEGLPETFFAKLEARKRREPRFADPVIRLLDLKGNLVC